MNVLFILQSAVESADYVFAVPEECVDQDCWVHRKTCAVGDSVDDWQEHWGILIIFRLVKDVLSNDGTEIVPCTSVVEWNGQRHRHVL